MLFGAHIFAGALLGLAIRHLSNDRRAVPVCMAGSIIPDLIDKPLGLVFPSVLGGGRTVFHTLIIVGIMLLCIVIFARSASRWLGAGMACAVLLHQVMDEMWILPANWLYPLFGPFQGHMIPDYIGIYFWNEMSDPSEWMFVIGAVMILALAYPSLVPRRCRSDRMKTGTPAVLAMVFLATGVYLVVAGITGFTPTFITPHYAGLPVVMAGLLALCGTWVMGRGIATSRRKVS